MDTRLKKTTRSKLTKGLAFIAVVLLLTLVGQIGQSLIFTDLNLESIFLEDYAESNEFEHDVAAALINSSGLLIDSTEELEDRLKLERDYYYYVSDGKDKSFSNVEDVDKDFFGKNKIFYAYEDGEWTYNGDYTPSSPRIPNSILQADETLYLAFPDSYLEAKQKDWISQGKKLRGPLIAMLVAGLVSLILIIYLLLVTGRQAEDEEIHLSFIDRIYSDILIVILFVLLGLGAMSLSASLSWDRVWGSYRQEFFKLFLAGATVFFTTSVGLIILSLTRKIKARRLIKDSLFYRIFALLGDFIRSIFDGRRFEKFPLTRSLFFRQLIFIALSGFLVVLALIFLLSNSGLGLLFFIIEMGLIYYFVKGNNLSYEKINKGFSQSLEEQMKAERMKVNLITNVSHDLKTPLTSIISYIDLLSKDEDLSESARDYVGILQDKSDRLNQMVSDLFDLAKSTSGNISLNLELLDMQKLIEQILVEMEDAIQESGMELRLDLPGQAFEIMADGNKLYRVFQNLIDNALKYSMPGTRIFIDLKEEDGQVLATIKNISAYEMDFGSDEILQRFNRGDESRTSEGSGLGLSIAQSYTEVSGGAFDLEVDGDMFKVTVSYPLWLG